MLEPIGITFLLAFAFAMAVGYIVSTYHLRRDRLIRVLGDQLAEEEDLNEVFMELLLKARRYLECSPLEGVMDIVDEIDAVLDEQEDAPLKGYDGRGGCGGIFPANCNGCDSCGDTRAVEKD